MNPYHEDVPIRRGVSLFETPATTGQVLGAVAEESWESNPFMALKSAYELDAAKRFGNRMLKAEAAKRLTAAGIPEAIKDIPYGYVSEDWVAMQEQFARARQRRELVLSRAEGGFFQNAARFGVSLGVSLGDPLNIGASFIPFYGQARYTSALAKATTVGGRAWVRTKFGFAEGAAGAALLEPLVYSSMQAQYADYDLTDSLLNVGVGSVLGAGLHAGAGAIRDKYVALRKAGVPEQQAAAEAVRTPEITGTTAARIADFTPDERAAMLRVAVAQTTDGYVDVEALAGIIETRRKAIDGVSAQQRELFIQKEIQNLETWIDAQKRVQTQVTPDEFSTAREIGESTPDRIKARTRELQSQGKKFKAAKKQATQEIEAENVRLNQQVRRVGEADVGAAKQMERAQRELIQLRQGNIPVRLRERLKDFPMPDIPPMGRVEVPTEQRIWKDELIEHLRALKRHGEIRGKALLRPPDQPASVKAELDQLEPQESVDDIQRDIDELAQEYPDMNTTEFDEMAADLESSRQANHVAADCVMRNAA